MIWERMTSPEIAAVDRATPIVLSLAAVEQHGPHLGVATDAVIGAHLLAALEAARPDGVLLLPQVKVGCSEHHMDFAGTLTLTHATFMALVSDMVGAVVRQGFRSIVLLNSHGGNQAVGALLAETLGAAHPSCRIVFATWWRLAAEALAGITEGGAGATGHACEFETSLMLAAAPADVRADIIPARSGVETFAWAGGDMLAAPAAAFYRTMAEQTGGTGVAGDPSLAGADKGRRITAAVTDALARIVDDLAAAPPRGTA
ncbi:MAG: creatininase family protein [Acuticoccus sp.]